MNISKLSLIFLLALFCIFPRSFSSAFPNQKPETIFITTPADLNRSDIRTLTDASGIRKLGLSQGAIIVIPNANSNIGYVVIPMGKSGNNIFLEFSLVPEASNNYAVVHALAEGIIGNQPGSIESIERILTADYTKKDTAMKYPSQKNIIVKLYSDKIPGAKPKVLGSFSIQQGPSDIINILIRKPADMQRVFIHEFTHFLNRDIIDGASSVMLSETLTLLLEDKCFNNAHYRFCGSTDLYNSITSSGVVDPKKLTDVISAALLANNDYQGYEYQIAELLGKVLMEKVAGEMPRASANERIIEVVKRITAIQRDFSRILPTDFEGQAKSLNVIAKLLGFSGGFPDMANSIGAYYEKNVYADAKKLASLKYLLEELRLSAARDEETQLEIPLPKKPAPLVMLAYDPKSNSFVGIFSADNNLIVFGSDKVMPYAAWSKFNLKQIPAERGMKGEDTVNYGGQSYHVTKKGWDKIEEIIIAAPKKGRSSPVAIPAGGVRPAVPVKPSPKVLPPVKGYAMPRLGR